MLPLEFVSVDLLATPGPVQLMKIFQETDMSVGIYITSFAACFKQSNLFCCLGFLFCLLPKCISNCLSFIVLKVSTSPSSLYLQNNQLSTLSKCIALSSSPWRPWLSPVISPRGLSSFHGKEVMPSSLYRFPRKTVNTHAERLGASSQAEVTHAAPKDVSEPDELHRVPP